MARTLETQIVVESIPLSPASLRALRRLSHYDLIIFTSKNARQIFNKTLQKYRLPLPSSLKVIQVGPRADLLKIQLRNERILFPRSVLAPFDIVRKMRARGAVVRVVPLYTAHGAPLTHAQKESLLNGKIKSLYFKSPSGIDGFLQELPRNQRKTVLSIPALCIGQTTAQAARKAGFKQVSAKNV